MAIAIVPVREDLMRAPSVNAQMNSTGNALRAESWAEHLKAMNGGNLSNPSSISPLAQKLGSGESDGSGDASGMPELVRQMLQNKNPQNQGPNFMGPGGNPGALPQLAMGGDGGGAGGDGGGGAAA